MANTSKQQILTLHAKGGELYNAAAEQQQNIIGQRIAEARKRAEISLAKFSALLEEYGVTVTAAGINKWEVGKAVPNAYQLMAVSQALHMDDALSLFIADGSKPELNEEGLKKVAAYKADLIATGKYKPRQKASSIIKFVEMPVSTLAVSAGTGAFLDEGNFEMVSFPESMVPTGAEFGLRVSGDSMEPVYHNDQIVWVQRCEKVGIGEVGIFIYDGEGYIKVYDEQEPDEADREAYTGSYGDLYMQPVMISYNQKYQPRYISAHSNFRVVGRVL